jgi:hypothetical protein
VTERQRNWRGGEIEESVVTERQRNWRGGDRGETEIARLARVEIEGRQETER